MRSIFRSIFLTCVAAASFSFSAQHTGAEETPLRIAVEGNFPPFNYLDANGDLQGFDVEVSKAICQAMAVECELVVQAWEEMIPGLIEEKYDAIISSMSMSAERRAKVAFTSRYYDSPTVFVTPMSSSIQEFDAPSLGQARLGVTLSTAQEAYARNLYGSTSIVVFPSSPELYQGLADGAVDLILEDKLAAYDWLTNTRAGECCEFRGDDIKDTTYFGDGAGIALRKEDKGLLASFEAALTTITGDGSYNTINAKYFPFSIR